jgi:glycine/D-amino acid oxidase-like deaminating enzyme
MAHCGRGSRAEQGHRSSLDSMSTAAAGRSPWIEQLDPDIAPQPLLGDATTDVAVIGAGIAGVATAFFLLRETDVDVLLIERDRAGRGATGHNAGQLTTYFERPLYDLVDTYGFEQAMAAQHAIEQTWDLLATIVAESGATAPIDHFVGHMGMFTLNHITVHLRSSLLRRQAGMYVQRCVVADEAPFVNDIPAEFDGLYSIVPMSEIRELLRTNDDRYCAVLSDRKGCANGALLIEQILEYLQTAFADRFQFVDHTAVDRVELHSNRAKISAGGYEVTAATVVMCTNGFVDHVVENLAGADIRPELHHRVMGDVGYMVGFVEDAPSEANAFSYIRNETIGGDTPYVYLTSRPHQGPRGAGTLVCIGGPEQQLDDVAVYSPDWEFPASVIDEIDGAILPIVHPTRPGGLDYDYTWHGLMGYSESRVRLIGFEPKNPVLMYNLGCNGVGFLQSIYGGCRIGRLVAGEQLSASIFDPP